MVAPTRVGWVAGSNSGAGSLTLSNPSGAQAGDRVIAFVSHTGASATITDLQGWTLLSVLTFNTRRWHILERAYASSYPALTLSTTEGMLWAVVAIRPTLNFILGATTLGATWRRVDNGGSINTTQAPSVTAPADTLALAFFSETSTGAEVEADTSLSGAGWAKWFWSKAVAGDANPVNYLAYAEPAAGGTGAATTTWLNNSNNGAGVQLLVPQTTTAVDVSGTGSLTLAGSASRSVLVTRTASGVLSSGGAVASSVAIARLSSGVLTLAGATSATTVVVRSADGALSLTGSASSNTGAIERSASGTVGLGGGATATVAYSRTAVGELTVGGIADATPEVITTAIGILVLAGVGKTVWPGVPSRLTLVEVKEPRTLTPFTVSHTLEEA